MSRDQEPSSTAGRSSRKQSRDGGQAKPNQGVPVQPHSRQGEQHEQNDGASTRRRRRTEDVDEQAEHPSRRRRFSNSSTSGVRSCASTSGDAAGQDPESDQLPLPQARRQTKSKPIRFKPSKAGQRWTKEMNTELLRARSQNTPYEAIGNKLGKTGLGCRLHMHNLQKHERGRAALAHQQEMQRYSHYQPGGVVLGAPGQFNYVFGSGQQHTASPPRQPANNGCWDPRASHTAHYQPQPEHRTLRQLMPAPRRNAHDQQPPHITSYGTMAPSPSTSWPIVPEAAAYLTAYPGFVQAVNDAIHTRTEDFWPDIARKMGTTVEVVQQVFHQQQQAVPSRETYPPSQVQRPSQYPSWSDSDAAASLQALSAGHRANLSQIERPYEPVSPRTEIAQARHPHQTNYIASQSYPQSGCPNEPVSPHTGTQARPSYAFAPQQERERYASPAVPRAAVAFQPPAPHAMAYCEPKPQDSGPPSVIRRDVAEANRIDSTASRMSVASVMNPTTEEEASNEEASKEALTLPRLARHY